MFHADVDKGHNINASDKNGCNALINAAGSGNVDVVRFLIEEQKADINYYDEKGFGAITVASYLGHLDIVIYLSKHPLHVLPPTSHNPLIAASSTDLKTLQYLIEDSQLDLEVDGRGPQGYTPFMMAAESGHFPIMKYLASLSCDLYAKNDKGQDVISIVQQDTQIPSKRKRKTIDLIKELRTKYKSK